MPPIEDLLRPMPYQCRNNLVGLYISDDVIDLACGYDKDADGFNPKDPFESLRVHMSGDGDERCSIRFSPGETVEDAFGRIAEEIRLRCNSIRAICIGCYGPFENIAKRPRTYGTIQNLFRHRRMEGKDPKELLSRALEKAQVDVPSLLTVQTDVACAALGEKFLCDSPPGEARGIWNEGKRDDVLAFIKSSIGIGAAFSTSLRAYSEHLHSEMGQMLVRPWVDQQFDPDEDESRFVADFGKHIRLEKVAGVPAICDRYRDKSFEELVDDPEHPAWHRQAYYLAQLCYMTCVMGAPSKIVIGGRVMRVAGLIEKIRHEFREIIGQKRHPYYQELEHGSFIDRDRSHSKESLEPGKPGVVGALLMAAMQARVGEERL